ncbi:hypothetical protein U9M48_041911 [Paspalum notatum var. saurae]|uniref:Integrase zinc-binding domain-containing protein n=1 Tax=Paspalum notatum var. saurae TaxID=547442 RepID=A0AAQ3UTP6_PASNO
MSSSSWSATPRARGSARFNVVQHQGARTLAFFSRPFAPRHLKVAAYERKLIGLAVPLGMPLPPPHQPLQPQVPPQTERLLMIPQHHWMSKLFGYDFTVEYRLGHLNTVADALSRHDADSLPAADNVAGGAVKEGGSLAALSAPTFQLYTDLAGEAASDPECVRLREQLAHRDQGEPWSEQQPVHSSRVFVPPSSTFLPQIPHLAHSAHEGIQKTLHRLRANFYLRHVHTIVRDYVHACTICQ